MHLGNEVIVYDNLSSGSTDNISSWLCDFLFV